MKAVIAILSSLLLASCVSYSHKPNLDDLVSSFDCKNINGSYVYDNKTQGIVFLRRLFGTDQDVDRIEIDTQAEYISVNGTNSGDVILTREIRKEDFTCKDSVLTLDIDNEYVNNGGVTTYSGLKVEIFSKDKNTLTFRFLEVGGGLVFLIPVFYAGDDVTTLVRAE